MIKPVKLRPVRLVSIFLALISVAILYQNCSSGNGFQPLPADATSGKESAGLTDPPFANGAMANVTYSESTASIRNPERGFFWMTDCHANPLSASQLQRYAAEGKTIMHCMFYLRDFKNSAIDAATLTLLQNQFTLIRAAGFKMIIRFAYTDTGTDDAPVSQMLSHLDQLAPILQSNSDVLFLVQAGQVGSWGEWAASNNLGNAGSFSAQNWSDRKLLIDKWMAVLPSNRMIALRTPEYKMHFFGNAPLTSAEAFTSSAKARIGQHNDCFLASSTDFGTYTNFALELPWLAEETKFLPMGGETCQVNAPRSSCASAQAEMARFHWSHLHEGYNEDVYTAWKNEGCFDQVSKSLGHRFVLDNGSFSTSATAGGAVNVRLSLRNVGYSAPFLERRLELILRNSVSGAVYRLPMKSDPRTWLPGGAISVAQTLAVPATMPAGQYRLWLNLPDPDANLGKRAEYSIQFANTGLWDAGAGFNDLKATLTIL